MNVGRYILGLIFLVIGKISLILGLIKWNYGCTESSFHVALVMIGVTYLEVSFIALFVILLGIWIKLGD